MKCILGKQLDDLPSEARAAVENQLGRIAGAVTMSDVTLSALLREAGMKIGKTTINIHRRELCDCYRRNNG